jgi:hypothetical protein
MSRKSELFVAGSVSITRVGEVLGSVAGESV